MIVLVGALGCAGSPAEEVSLADMTAWQPAPTGRDPYPGHRPDEVSCPSGATIVEGTTFEVDTGECGYALLEQPLRAPVKAGEAVELVFWHNDLAAVDEAEAHVVFAVDGAPWFERTVPIPSLATAYSEVIDVPAAADAGVPLVLHLHNHGANTWNVLRITRLAESPPP